MTVGNVVQTVAFTPMVGVTTQMQVVTITFEDDDIALEEDEVIRFSLNNSVGIAIPQASSTVDLIVEDDDGMHEKIYNGAICNYLLLS